MILAVLTVELEIPCSNSLKDKRKVLNRVKERVRNKFNVSIAEVASNDVWNYAELGVALVSNEKKFANQVISKVSEFIESLHDYVVVDISVEFINL